MPLRAPSCSWKGVYGGAGYNVINNAVNYPPYVSPSISGALSHTWNSATASDSRTLQQAASPSQRIAATWYAADYFVIDLPFTGSQSHQFAVYCLDYDNLGRSETLEILDAGG